jgi:hypothetical protein
LRCGKNALGVELGKDGAGCRVYMQGGRVGKEEDLTSDWAQTWNYVGPDYIREKSISDFQKKRNENQQLRKVSCLTLD